MGRDNIRDGHWLIVKEALAKLRGDWVGVFRQHGTYKHHVCGSADVLCFYPGLVKDAIGKPCS